MDFKLQYLLSINDDNAANNQLLFLYLYEKFQMVQSPTKQVSRVTWSLKIITGL